MQCVRTGTEDTGAGEFTPRRILVAEDNATNRRITELLLTGAGHEVTCVANAKAAVQALRDGRFDIAIVDLHLPDASGIEIAENAPKSLPIVLLTGDADPSLTERALRAGCVALLHKPLRAETLRRVVETHTPMQAAQSTGVTAVNPAVVEELSACGAEPAELESLINGFVRETRIDAMRVQQAASREDWETVRSLLHARSGAAQVIGAEALSRLLSDLELRAATADSAVFWTQMTSLKTTIARTEAALMRTLDHVARRHNDGDSGDTIRYRTGHTWNESQRDCRVNDQMDGDNADHTNGQTEGQIEDKRP